MKESQRRPVGGPERGRSTDGGHISAAASASGGNPQTRRQ